MKNGNSMPVAGVAWYQPEQWPLLKKNAADPDVLEDTYEEWLKMAETAVINLEKQGVLIERVTINIEDLLRWCRARNRPLDGSARAEFTTRQLRRKHEEGGERTA